MHAFVLRRFESERVARSAPAFLPLLLGLRRLVARAEIGLHRPAVPRRRSTSHFLWATGAGEAARRRRQIAAGRLKAENGVVFDSTVEDWP